MTDSIPTSVVTTATNTTTTTLPTAVTPTTTATTDTDSTTTAVVTVSNDRKKILPLPLTDISKPNNNNNNNNSNSSSSKTRHCTSLPLFYNASELCTLGARPGMECMPLRAPPGPYHHYHVSTDQTKSLQELQNEVGALLEFRDLVIETFPDLKHKMASMSQTNTLTGMASASSLASRREWEPGIRVKRKLAQKENTDMSSSSLIRSRSNSHSGKKEPKSGEGNGSVVQDSGFSTETSSSKEAHSASSTTGAMQGNAASNRLTIDADDELLNLLDVIHRKSNRLREEVEQLQNIERDKFRKNVTHSNSSDNSCLHKTFQDHVDRLTKEDIQVLRKERDRLLDKLAEMEAETLAGRIKATKMQDQVEELSTVKKELEDQLKVALSQKLELNSRLHELHTKYGVRNSSSSSESTTSRYSVATTIPVVSGNAITPTQHFSQQQLIQGASGNQLTNNSHFPVLSSSSSSTITATSTSATASNTTYSPVIGQNRDLDDSKNIYTFPGDNTKQIKNNRNNLGRLDGLVSSPNRSTKVRATDTKKIAAILLETNVLELRRHLLTLTIQNQALKDRLDQETKSNIFLMKKIDKSKEDIEDMRFQLEEKDIELEGTKAQLRVLESKTPSRLDFNIETNRSSSTIILSSRDSPLIQTQISTPSMKAMVPLAIEEIQQHSSSTESAQDQTERDSRTCLETPKRRPSKIPLPGSGTKSYLAPKPPTGRSPGSQKSPSGPVSNKSLSKSTGSLYGKSGPPSIKRLDVQTPSFLRPESAQSIRKDNSLGTNSRSSSSSIPISSKSTPSPHKISSSPLPKPKRDSLTSRVRHLDSLSRVQNVTSTSSSNINTNNNSTIQVTTSSVNNSQKQLINNSNTKKDLSSSFTQGQIRDRKQGTVSVRRVSSASVGRGTGVDVQQNESDSGKIKTIRNKEIEKQFMSSSSAGKDIATNGKVIKTTKSTPNSTLTPSSSNPTSPTKRNYVAKPQFFSNIQPLTIPESTNVQPKSHGLIGEYLAKTCPPPPILKPSFTPSSPRSPDLLKMAYTHPQLLLFDMEIEDDTELDSRNNVIYEKNNEIEYVEDSRDHVQSPKYSKQDETDRTMTKRRAIYIESNFNIYNQNLSDDRNENKCKLVGKVNPKIAKTWEQLNAVGIREPAPRTFLRSISNNSDESDKLILCQPQESKSNFRVNKVIYSEESSDEFYDSIDGVQDDGNNLNDHMGNIVSISHEDAGEEMAEINSFDHYNRNYWSIDSSELV